MAVSAKDKKEYLEWVEEYGPIKNTTPAVLFYQEDFITGVAEMSKEERGDYITLLAYQNIHGRMSKDYIDRVCPNCSKYVLEKFDKDENGLYYNWRMEFEIWRRVKKQKTLTENLQKESQKADQMGTQKESQKAPLSETETETEKETVKNQEIINQVIGYLNDKTGARFKPTSKATSTKINARLNEGHDLDDFIKVIDRKCNDWLNDPKMAQHLAPDTLFGPKFEKYLNAPTAKRGSGNEVLDLLQGGVFR